MLVVIKGAFRFELAQLFLLLFTGFVQKAFIPTFFIIFPRHFFVFGFSLRFLVKLQTLALTLSTKLFFLRWVVRKFCVQPFTLIAQLSPMAHSQV